ncbi:MAG: LuxR C-terminal-related transcriptional regulator [Planctomycetota bacterium]|nr:LuxR C-terminal-related transcriptional regulator [Planctomycetota bacterium]
MERAVHQLLAEHASDLQNRDFGELCRGPGLVKVDQGSYTYVLARFRSRPGTRSALTRRDEDVVRLVTQGLSNKGIAQELSLSPATIAAYLRRIYRKLGVDSRAALARESLLMTRTNADPRDRRRHAEDAEDAEDAGR